MGSHESFYHSCLEQAKQALKQEDYATAVKKATSAVSINPTAEAYLLRIQCLIEVNDLNEAAKNLESAAHLINSLPEGQEKESLKKSHINLLSALRTMLRVQSEIENLEDRAIRNGNPLALLPTYELQQHEKRLSKLASHAIKMQPKEGSLVQPGQSKFGGTADGVIAPRTSGGTHLPLILQINFAELSQLVAGLPEHGLLYFFFAPDLCEELCNSPADRKAWKVIYEPNPKVSVQAPQGAKWQETPIEFATITSLPSVLAPHFQGTDFMTASELQKYHALLQKIQSPFDHHLFGYPGLVQPESLNFHAQLLSQGIDVRQAMKLERSVGEKHWQASHSWGLLAQIDWNPTCDMWWGNYGRLTFWIKNEDLAHANFNNVMLQWQTHTVLLSMFPETFANTEHCLAARNALWEKEIFNPWKSQLKP